MICDEWNRSKLQIINRRQIQSALLHPHWKFVTQKKHTHSFSLTIRSHINQSKAIIGQITCQTVSRLFQKMFPKVVFPKYHVRILSNVVVVVVIIIAGKDHAAWSWLAIRWRCGCFRSYGCGDGLPSLHIKCKVTLTDDRGGARASVGSIVSVGGQNEGSNTWRACASVWFMHNW